MNMAPEFTLEDDNVEPLQQQLGDSSDFSGLRQRKNVTPSGGSTTRTNSAAVEDVLRTVSESVDQKNRRLSYRLNSQQHKKYSDALNESEDDNDSTNQSDTSHTYPHVQPVAPRTESSSIYAAKRAEVNVTLRRASFCAILTWISLAIFVIATTPSDEMEYLSGIEKNAALLAASILFVSCFARVMPIIFFQKKGRNVKANLLGDDYNQKGQSQQLSGALIGGITVQFIAVCTDTIMAFAKVPVRIDPILKSRVHMLRWCEWTPLAFLMTYMTELVDVPIVQPQDLDSNGKSNPNKRLTISVPLLHALSQGLSTICGLYFPYAPDVWSWSIVMFLSCVLYLVIFARLHYKMKLFKTMKRGTTVDEIELYDRSRLSLRLLITCTVMWTLLVTGYYVSSLGPTLAPNNKILAHPALTMISEATMDVVAKVIYMIIIVDVHDSIFDDSARADRRLNELRHMMSVVWKSSSDLIAISVKDPDGVVSTIVSPTYKRYIGKDIGAACANNNKSNNKDELEVMFILPPEALFSTNDESQQPTQKPSLLSRQSSFFGFSGNQHNSYEENNNFTKESSASSNTHPSASKHLDKDGPLAPIADLIVRAWKTKGKESLFVHNLVLSSSKSKDIVRCETKVNRLEENAIVVIARDTSEQYHRFEAEKRFISETAARQKDAEANRFTRHEVKNGLLAAIGLFDSLKESLEEESRRREEAMAEKGDGGSTADTSSMTSMPSMPLQDQTDSLAKPLQMQKEVISSLLTASAVYDDKSTPMMSDKTLEERSRCLDEIGKTLHEVLDTVLAEAMARDVIHEVYEPKLEKVDIAAILADVRGFHINRERFPLVTFPSPLPLFAFDPQLLKYIHRNAVSNAYKYGKKGGAIMTEVRYNDRGDGKGGTLELNVINLPGDHHEALLRMGPAAADIVFSPGKRLHSSSFKKNQQQNPLHSSGDGAWIIRKCAKTLGGDCNIVFESNRTTFTLRCPAMPFDEAMKDVVSVDPKNFQLPPGMTIWGIAIDDSGIQRKLMRRFLSLVGIKANRCIILGKDAEETKGFVDFVVDFVERHPHDFFLLIADENLDMVDESSRHITVSGSLCIQSIRKKLLPDQERRMLALVRSANDSSHDIAIYNSRAHGFLPKAPINKDKVLEMIAPLWENRYPSFFKDDKSVFMGENITGNDGEEPRIEGNIPKVISTSDLNATLHAEIVRSLEIIDAFTLKNESYLKNNWHLIWEKIHLLLGDLKSIDDSFRGRSNAIEAINLLRGPTLPKDFVARWMVIRSLIMTVIES